MSQEEHAANLGTLATNGLEPNITEVLIAQRELEDLRYKVRELAAVEEVHRSFARLPSLKELLAHINEKIGDLLDVEKAGVMLYDPERNELVLQQPAFGIDDDDLISTYHVPLNGKGNAITVFLTGEPYLSNDSFHDPRVVQKFAHLFNARSILTVPLFVEKRCIGVLHAVNKRSRVFDQNDLQLLRLLADHLASLIEIVRLHEREEQRIRELEKLNQVIRDQHDKLQRAAAIHDRLTQMVLHGSGIDGIARTLAGLVENPVAVEDKFFQLICFAPNPTSKSQKSSMPGFKGTPATALEDARFREQMKAMSRSKHPTKMPAYPQFGLFWSRLIAAITVGKPTFGYVSIFEENRQFSELDIVALEHAATVFALELQKQKAAFEVEQRLKGDFLDDLLMGNYDNDEVMLRRAAFLDYDLSHPHVLMVVDIDSFGDFLGKSGSNEREANAIKKRLFELVYGKVSSMPRKNMVVSKSDRVIALLDLSSDADNHNGVVNLEEVAEGIKQEVKAHLPKISVSIAISDRCERPGDYRHSFQLAQKSLELVKAFNQRDRILRFDRLGIYQLLLEIEDKAKLKGFVDQLIGPLVSYDKKHNTSLVETLESYLQNDCNLYKTARVSFVHISTLKYRLQRVEEIAKVDLGDAETRLGLQLGLKVWRLIS